jgi:poly(3-hydroxyalkanoate) synthetase
MFPQDVDNSLHVWCCSIYNMNMVIQGRIKVLGVYTPLKTVKCPFYLVKLV